MKDSKFPFTVQPKYAEVIILCAPFSWKDTLIEYFHDALIHDKPVDVSEQFYKEMRGYMQPRILHDIFGKDEPTFEDCWNKVNGNGGYYIDRENRIEQTVSNLISAPHNYNVLPRKELARKVQLYIELLVVAEALNDGWTKTEHNGGAYLYLRSGKIEVGFSETISGDIYFKDTGTAEKARDICPDKWREYLTIQ